MKRKQIKVTCKGSDLVDFDDLVSLQGDLKKLNDKNFKKLQSSILSKGFSFPFFVWQDPKNKNHKILIDGHQRQRVLEVMRTEGYEIPKLPVCLIEADSIEDAKKKLLVATSSYGKVDRSELFDFLQDVDINFEEMSGQVELHEFRMDEFAADFFGVENDEDDNSGKDHQEDEELLIVVQCESENHQSELFDELSSRGLQCKLMS